MAWVRDQNFFNTLCTFAYGVKMKKTVFGARYQILVSLVPRAAGSV